MGGSGSGRRTIKAPAKGFSLTSPDGTKAGWERQLDEIQRGIVAGQVDPRTADTLIAATKVGVGLYVDEDKASRIRELKKLVERAEEVNRVARAREAADRTHAVGSAEDDDEDDEGD